VHQWRLQCGRVLYQYLHAGPNVVRLGQSRDVRAREQWMLGVWSARNLRRNASHLHGKRRLRPVLVRCGPLLQQHRLRMRQRHSLCDVRARYPRLLLRDGGDSLRSECILSEWRLPSR
jgi:hypothetical protein